MLTNDSICQIMNGADHNTFQPIVQIIKIEKSSHYYVFDISDGKYFHEAKYPASEYKEALDNFIIVNYHVIKLIDYCINPWCIFQFEQRFNPNQMIGHPNYLFAEPLKLTMLNTDKESIELNEVEPFENEFIINENLVFDMQKGKNLKKNSKEKSGIYAVVTKKIIEKIDAKLKVSKNCSDSCIKDIKDIPTQRASLLSNPKQMPILLQKTSNDSLFTKKIDFSLFPASQNYNLHTIHQVLNREKYQNMPWFEKIYILCYIGKKNLSDRNSIWYEGCVNNKCNKKVVVQGNNSFYCPGCCRTYDKTSCRYRLLIPLHDSTGMMNVKIFDSLASVLIGKTANDLKIMNLINKEQAEKLMLKLLGKKIIAEVQAVDDKSGHSMDYVLVGFKPAEEAINILINDIKTIANII